nr:30S ribosomal protein S16 [Mycoplasmopsis felifaucium]
MVKIRLKRLGSKFNACYKIVVADARAPRDGRFIEAIGQYNPHTKAFVINEEATIQWIKNGAQITQTVFNLFRQHNLNEKFKNAAKANVEEILIESKKTTKKDVEAAFKPTKKTTKKAAK